MATSSLEDDFHSRIRKHFNAKFRDTIIPSHLIPYIQCLPRVEEEIVLAKETQFGPTLAADELFDLLLRRPNWVEDLTTALRNPGVGHIDLANEIENVISEVPLRYKIARMKDNHGTCCCDGHCEPINIDSRTADDEEINVGNDCDDPTSNTHLKCPIDYKETALKFASTPGHSLQTDKQFLADLKTTEATEHEEGSCETIANYTSSDESNADLNLRREKLKIQIIEKIWSFVEKPEDVPRALEAGEQICLQLQGVEKGSLLFKMKVKSLDDLVRLRDLVRYGGMKKILDQEVIDKNMEVFKDLAKSQQLELKSIDSKLYVHEADLQRCKSLILSQRDEQEAMGCMKGLVMPHFIHQIDITKQKRLKELLPPCCLKIMEDSFVQTRLSNFLKLSGVADAMKREIRPLTLNEVMDTLRWLEEPMKIKLDTQLRDKLVKALNEMKTREFRADGKRLPAVFFEWIGKELAAYFETLDVEDLQNLVQVRAVMFMADNFKTSEDTESKITLAEMPCFLQQRKPYGFFKHLPVIKTEELLSSANDKALSRLLSIGVLRETNGKYEFSSKLLRDTVLAHILDTYNISSAMDMDKYEFLPVTIGLYCEDAADSMEFLKRWQFEKFDTYMLAACCGEYSQHNLKSFETDREQHTSVYPTLDILWLNDSSGLTYVVLQGIVNLLLRTVSSKKGIHIQLLEEADFRHLTYLTPNWALKVLFLLLHELPGETVQTDISLNLSDVKFENTECMTFLLNYLEMSKFSSKLAMNRCEITPEALAAAFMTGNFANMKHLTLSETRITHEASEHLGLRYMPKLHTIDLHSCELQDTGMTLLAQELRLLEELKEINISNNAISAEGLQELSNELGLNHGITALRVQNNDIGPEGALVLAGWLKRLYLLEILNISNCNIKDAGIQYVSKSIVTKVLRQISMRENNITEHGSVDFFENMKGKPMFEHLDYGRNSVFHVVEYSLDNGNKDPPYIPLGQRTFNRTQKKKDHKMVFNAFLNDATHWSHLNMWDCNLGAQRVFQDYDKFHALKNLVHLCLQSNHIDNAFAKDVGACLKRHCVYIRQINLRHNRIGNTGAAAIADGITGKSYLEELLIDRNQIEEDGIRTLLNVTLEMDHSLKLDASCNNLARLDIERLVLELSLQICDPSEEMKDEKDLKNLYVPHDSRFSAEIYM